MSVPVNIDDLLSGATAFVDKEKRDGAYGEAMRIILAEPGSPSVLADAMALLLREWHHAFYRFGSFSKQAIREWCAAESAALSRFARIDLILADEVESQKQPSRNIWYRALEATKGVNRKFTRRSPTAASKALHVAAPSFFPLWDREISIASEHVALTPEYSFESYWGFLLDTRSAGRQLMREWEDRAPQTGESLAAWICERSGATYKKGLLKLLDELNYARFTKRWV